jgi:hypothetical protein
MKFEIIHEISETKREIYNFEVHNHSIIYKGIQISRRNDAKDVWGDLWQNFYAECRASELDYSYLNNSEEEDINEIQEILDKYNPVVQKTDSGKSYLQRSFGKDLPIPNISKDQIKEEIMWQFIKLMDNIEFSGI